MMIDGPRMITKMIGRKNRIIGTVSFGGRAAAFFSASDMRMSRFSLAMTRSAWLTGVLVTLYTTGTTLNVQSLMGVLMMVGIVVSNSILIVDFARRQWEDGTPLEDAVALAGQIRLRPILMTSLATMIGLLPMALKLGAGSEAYAPLARAIIGGLGVSLVFTIFLVPVAFMLLYRGRTAPQPEVAR